MNDRGPLLDLVYGTVVQPGLWVTAVERIADSIGASSGSLSRVSVENGSGSFLLARRDPAGLSAYLSHFARVNPFAIKPDPRVHMRNWRSQVTTDKDYLPREALLAHEFYNDFMRVAEQNSVMMIDLIAKGFDVVTINLYRRAGRELFGPAEIAFAEALRPHLLRASKLGGILAERDGLNESRAEALEQLSRGVVILDARGHVRYANRAAERVLGERQGLRIEDGRLVAAGGDAAKRLAALIGAAADPEKRRGGSLLVPSQGRSPLSITIGPLRPEGLPLFDDGPGVLVGITDMAPDEAVLGERLQAAFALTAAEVRVALALLRGISPKGAAETFGVRLSTIRSQMASVFGKTGTAGQAELSRLMLRLADSSLQ